MAGSASYAQPLHPESTSYLELLSQLNLAPYHKLATIEEARHRSRTVAARYTGNVEYNGTKSELVIPSPHATAGIPVFVYTPTNVSQQPSPAILIYFHGGGNVVGCRENVESMCQILSNNAGCVVVNVQYRLAPEHKMPASMDDGCVLATWVLHNKTVIGVLQDSAVGVAGDSAGGTIAASVAHEVKGLAFQILIYPHVSARGDRHLKSFQEYKDGPILPAALIDWFENHMAAKEDFTNPRIASLLRTSFKDVPPGENAPLQVIEQLWRQKSMLDWPT